MSGQNSKPDKSTSATGTPPAVVASVSTAATTNSPSAIQTSISNSNSNSNTTPSTPSSSSASAVTVTAPSSSSQQQDTSPATALVLPQQPPTTPASTVPGTPASSPGKALSQPLVGPTLHVARAAAQIGADDADSSSSAVPATPATPPSLAAASGATASTTSTTMESSAARSEQPAATATATSAADQVDGLKTAEAQGQSVDAAVAGAKVGAKDKKSKKCAKVKGKGKHHKHSKGTKCSSKKKKKKKRVVESESESDSESDSDSDSSSDSSSSDDESDMSDDSDSELSDSEVEKLKKKKKKLRKAREKKKAAAKKKSKKSKKSKRREELSSDSDSSDSESDSSDEEEARKKRKKRSRKSHDDDSKDEDSSEQTTQDEATTGATDASTTVPATTDGTSSVATTMATLLAEIQKLTAANAAVASSTQATGLAGIQTRAALRSRRGRRLKPGLEPEELKPKKGGKPEFKRVDQLWDSNIHDYKLTETAEEQPDEFDGYVFHVRRRFDWENKYRNTVVDIKSHYLRDALQEIMKDVKAVSLVENQPTIDPNMLFLHVDEMRKFYKKTLKARIRKERKKKNIKRLKTMRAHLKLMVNYIDKDFDEKKKAIFPMIKAGNITFEYLWALFKPNSLAYTTTYGSADHPRCFKVDFAYAEKNFMRGEYYVIEGRYLDYDGKNFGLGDFELQIDHFKGPRKITSLNTYPITFHKDPEGLKKQLLDRGKQFINLAGMNFKLMKGLAFQKRKKQVLKFNINGRVMIDPKTFRRINANYQVSGIKDENKDDDDSDSDSCSDCQEDDDDDGDDAYLSSDESAESKKPKYRVVWDDDNKPHVVPVTDDDDEEEEQQKLDQLPNGTDEEAGATKNKSREFTEEELIIASPVVLGFSFTEKSWFEFAVSDVSEIIWNDSAFETLVLPKDHKELVKAQVKSHKFHAAETIDDVIQGKGKGLVFVLHGPPGVGKTLTAEGIAEFLKCPLYAVSAGDLGTDARTLEHELNKIMDIAHSWGAVLLLDEADVFLEKRQHQDVHRNALVSIFLRLLEYFQGILFLTTNRVETFDEAFQSRIHIALKYAELGIKAKKDIWRSFVAMVRHGGGMADELSNNDFDELARHNLNGRQIKNMVRSAQALAVLNKESLSMRHFRQVIEVTESFDRDIRGGDGYLDAMRSYT